MSSNENGHRRLIVLAGATASGKSDVAMHLGGKTPIEIVCADARTIYRGLDIGTAKPPPADLALVKHHLLDIVEPHQSYTASAYATAARSAIESIDINILPVIVGGSGFYIKALIDGLSEGVEEVDQEIRTQLTKEFEERGIEAMHEELATVDARAAAMYSDRNPRRVQRALEYHRATGKALSSAWEQQRNAAPYDVCFVAVHRERDELRRRIEDRCALMWRQGLLHETEQLLTSGLDEHVQSLQTVGYKQAIDVLRGRTSIELAQLEMITATWQYAKRQLTWFRKDARYQWVAGNTNECARDILRLFKHEENRGRG